MLVVGAMRSGVAACEALVRRGVTVRLADRRSDIQPAVAHAVDVRLGEQDPEELIDGVDVLVRSPGIPSDAPIMRAAALRRLPVWSEVELGYRLLAPQTRLIGITGTNGKTTTTELTCAMLNASGIEAVCAGNVGTALTAVAETAPPGVVIVCELSSFQLEDVRTLRCDAAALLNLTPDHLDRHQTITAYGRAKLRIFERQRASDTAVLNDDDPWTAALQSLPGGARVVRVHAHDADADSFTRSALRGDHNRQNTAVAAALARSVGASDTAIAAAVVAFRPPPHRLEYVGSRGEVTFWNDSKATNPDAAVKALTAFPEGAVRLILGGSDKGIDYTPLAAGVSGVVRCAYLTGPGGERMRPLLEPVVPLVWCGTLERAVTAAAADAQPGDAVLLAPACASFDEFRDYAERGDRFREIAHTLGAC
jgi:UDP-N-acetylmuramoylalanine--D-glutamate ligase